MFESVLSSEALQAAGYLLTGAALVLMEVGRARIFRWWKNRYHNPIEKAVRSNQQVHQVLVELMVRLTARRTYVHQFHNGSEFISRLPIWKVTRTQEAVMHGVTSEVGSSQEVLAELMAPLIELLFLAKDGTVTTPGITPLPVDSIGASGGVYLIDSMRLPDGFVKSWYQSHGTRMAVICPLMNTRKQVMGFVGADLTIEGHGGWSMLTPAQCDDVSRYMRQAASTIWFELERAE